MQVCICLVLVLLWTQNNALIFNLISVKLTSVCEAFALLAEFFCYSGMWFVIGAENSGRELQY